MKQQNDLIHYESTRLSNLDLLVVSTYPNHRLQNRKVAHLIIIVIATVYLYNSKHTYITKLTDSLYYKAFKDMFISVNISNAFLYFTANSHIDNLSKCLFYS